jgi:hypothetical protein
VLVLPAAGIPVAAQAEPHVQVKSGPDGEVRLDAHDATVAQVLSALAEEGDFEVQMNWLIARPLVNISVPMSPIDDVLEQVLRRRNHALIYDGDAESPSRVIVLLPSSASKSRRGRPRHPPRRRRSSRSRGPTVVVQ